MASTPKGGKDKKGAKTGGKKGKTGGSGRAEEAKEATEALTVQQQPQAALNTPTISGAGTVKQVNTPTPFPSRIQHGTPHVRHNPHSLSSAMGPSDKAHIQDAHTSSPSPGRIGSSTMGSPPPPHWAAEFGRFC